MRLLRANNPPFSRRVFARHTPLFASNFALFFAFSRVKILTFLVNLTFVLKKGTMADDAGALFEQLLASWPSPADGSPSNGPPTSTTCTDTTGSTGPEHSPPQATFLATFKAYSSFRRNKAEAQTATQEVNPLVRAQMTRASQCCLQACSEIALEGAAHERDRVLPQKLARKDPKAPPYPAHDPPRAPPLTPVSL